MKSETAITSVVSLTRNRPSPGPRLKTRLILPAKPVDESRDPGLGFGRASWGSFMKNRSEAQPKPRLTRKPDSRDLLLQLGGNEILPDGFRQQFRWQQALADEVVV